MIDYRSIVHSWTSFEPLMSFCFLSQPSRKIQNQLILVEFLIYWFWSLRKPLRTPTHDLLMRCSWITHETPMDIDHVVRSCPKTWDSDLDIVWNSDSTELGTPSRRRRGGGLIHCPLMSHSWSTHEPLMFCDQRANRWTDSSQAPASKPTQRLLMDHSGATHKVLELMDLLSRWSWGRGIHFTW